MIGDNLKKAQEWFDRAVKKEEEKNVSMMEKCLEKALQFERDGIAAGESWD